jgi:hypothetical protein
MTASVPKFAAGDIIEWGNPLDTCTGKVKILWPHAMLVRNERDGEDALVARSRARHKLLTAADAEAWGVPDGTPVLTLPASHAEWLAEGRE